MEQNLLEEVEKQVVETEAYWRGVVEDEQEVSVEEGFVQQPNWTSYDQVHGY